MVKPTLWHAVEWHFADVENAFGIKYQNPFFGNAFPAVEKKDVREKYKENFFPAKFLDYANKIAAIWNFGFFDFLRQNDQEVL